jgi:hypothetical protein
VQQIGEKLLSLLLKFEELFNSTLVGDWNLPHVSFEIKEGMKPYHGRAYPPSCRYTKPY